MALRAAKVGGISCFDDLTSSSERRNSQRFQSVDQLETDIHNPRVLVLLHAAGHMYARKVVSVLPG